MCTHPREIGLDVSHTTGMGTSQTSSQRPWLDRLATCQAPSAAIHVGGCAVRGWSCCPTGRVRLREQTQDCLTETYILYSCWPPGHLQWHPRRPNPTCLPDSHAHRGERERRQSEALRDILGSRPFSPPSVIFWRRRAIGAGSDGCHSWGGQAEADLPCPLPSASVFLLRESLLTAITYIHIAANGD